jgi:hypothetical protein
MANQTPDTGPITLINVFEISPDDVEHFLQEWRERAQFLGRQPGFRCLRLHRALSPDSRFGWSMSPSGTAPRRCMHDFAIAANPALYRVVIEATAE